MYKIISIIGFSPDVKKLRKRFNNIEEFTAYYNNNVREVFYLDIDEPEERVFFFQEFAFNQLERLANSSSLSNTVIELWRPYIGIHRIYSRSINGVIYKLFPAVEKRDIFGRKQTISIDLVDLLRNEMKNKTLLIINYPSGFTHNLLKKTKPNKIPVLANKRGFWFEKFKKQKIFDLRYLYHLYKIYKQKLYLKKFIDYYGSVSITTEKKYLESINYKNYFYHQDGVDFDYFKPCANKNILKEKLGFDSSKKIILYVGRFYKTKDADFLMHAYNNMWNKKDYQLVMIGGNKEDEYYDYGLKVGAILKEKIPRNKLLSYYQIADVYVMPIRNDYVRYFGGMGRATIEALACGVPVITDQLMHFEGKEEERAKVGAFLNERQSLDKTIKYVLDHSHNYSNCREIARRYYTKERCNKRLVDYIEILMGIYY